MHERVIAGDSLHSITRSLNAQKVTTAKQRGIWSVNQVRSLLNRGRNAGLLEVGVYENRAGREIRVGAEVTAKSLIQPAVSMADWELVQGILKANRGQVVSGRKPEKSWLSGLMLCSVCGSRMVAKTITNKDGRNRYYMCETKVKRTGEPDSRRHPAIGAEVAEEGVGIELFRALMDGRIGAPTHDQTKTMREIQARLAELAEDRANATDLLLQRGVDKLRVRARLAEIDDDVIRLERQRAQLAGQSAQGTTLTELRDQLQGLIGVANFIVERLTGKAMEHDILREPVYDLNDEPSASLEVKGARLWAEVPFEKRREAVAGSMLVTVHPGKGFKRVRIELLPQLDTTIM